MQLYLATIRSPAGSVYAPRWIVVLTAVNKHSPQRTCPHGVIVAYDGGEKHIGQVYAANGSTSCIGTSARGLVGCASARAGAAPDEPACVDPPDDGRGAAISARESGGSVDPLAREIIVA